MAYLVSQIIKVIKAKLFPAKNAEDIMVDKLLIDSRSLVEPLGTMFIALKTQKNDGHAYIAELYQRGVRVFLVQKGYEGMEDFKGAVFLIVPDTLNALQLLATWHREH